MKYKIAICDDEEIITDIIAEKIIITGTSVLIVNTKNKAFNIGFLIA